MRLTIIIGFPRSGSSLLSHILSESVFYSGEEDQIRSSGIWESDLVASINEGLFSAFKIDGLDPEGVKQITSIDWQSHEIRSRVQRYTSHAQLVINSLIRQLKTVDGKIQIYWKDPRTSILLKFWIQAIQNGNRNNVFDENIDMINVVWCFRNPEEAIDSLMKLNPDLEYTYEQYLESWTIYNSYIAKILADNKVQFFLINYADIIKSAKTNIKRLFTFLGQDISNDDLVRLSSKVNPELHRSKSKKKVLSGLYTRLIELCSMQNQK